jgi:hypothetical protein
MRNTTSSRLGEAGCSGGGDGGSGGAIQTSVLAFFPYRWVRSARASALGYELCKAPVFCFSSLSLVNLLSPQPRRRASAAAAARAQHVTAWQARPASVAGICPAPSPCPPGAVSSVLRLLAKRGQLGHTQ